MKASTQPVDSEIPFTKKYDEKAQIPVHEPSD